MKLKADFSVEILQARRKQDDTDQVLRGWEEEW